MFLVLFVCNIPFIFMPGKEGLLVLVEEILHRSMSTAIQKRLNYPLYSPFNSSRDTNKDAFKVSRVSYIVSPKVYFSITYGVYSTLFILSFFIQDITIIFGFLGAFVESLFNFVLPGYLYLKSSSIRRVKR